MKKFDRPELEITVFEAADVITTSLETYEDMGSWG